MKKWAVDAEIMKLRGLGYTQKEIGGKLDMTQGAIHYRLINLKKRAEKEGVDSVYFELLTKLYVPKILRFLNVV